MWRIHGSPCMWIKFNESRPDAMPESPPPRRRIERGPCLCDLKLPANLILPRLEHPLRLTRNQWRLRGHAARSTSPGSSLIASNRARRPPAQAQRTASRWCGRRIGCTSSAWTANPRRAATRTLRRRNSSYDVNPFTQPSLVPRPQADARSDRQLRRTPRQTGREALSEAVR